MNVELMLKVADYIEVHPEQYNQSEWCGTECCVAGHALALHHAVAPSQLARMLYPSNFYLTSSAVLRRAIQTDVPNMAALVLDLDVWVSNVLFAGGLDWPQPFRLLPEDRTLYALGDGTFFRSIAANKAADFLRFLVTEHQHTQKMFQRMEETRVIPRPLYPPCAVEEHDEELVLA